MFEKRVSQDSLKLLYSSGVSHHHHHHQFIYSTTKQYKYSDNVNTNEVETGMTRLIALTVTPVY